MIFQKLPQSCQTSKQPQPLGSIVLVTSSLTEEDATQDQALGQAQIWLQGRGRKVGPQEAVQRTWQYSVLLEFINFVINTVMNIIFRWGACQRLLLVEIAIFIHKTYLGSLESLLRKLCIGHSIKDKIGNLYSLLFNIGRQQCT